MKSKLEEEISHYLGTFHGKGLLKEKKKHYYEDLRIEEFKSGPVMVLDLV